jgi:hypothetical protein
MTEPAPASSRKPLNPLLRYTAKTLKWLSWIVIALVLTVFGSLVCIVKVLTPEKLTAIVTNVANEALDADVQIGRIELSMQPSFPFLCLDVDSVTIVSHSLRGLDAEMQAKAPAYADTLLKLDSFHGGINIASLIFNKVDLQDVVFVAPEVNIVMAGDGISNFNIYTSTDTTTTDTTALELPAISIKRFAIEQPQPLRFADIESGTSGQLQLSEVELTGETSPTYALNFSGDFFTPLLSEYDLSRLTFGLNGDIAWDPKQPMEVSLDRFDTRLDVLKFLVSTQLDMTDDFIVKSAKVTLDPTKVTDLFALVPDSMRRDWGLTDTLRTNATVTLSAELTQPFNVSRDSIPYAHVDFNLPEAAIGYGKFQFNKLAIEASADLNGNDLDKATFSLKRFNIAGPMTEIELNADVSEMISDPLIDGAFCGKVNFSKMPTVLRKLIGCTVKGTVDADLTFKFRPSMFDRSTFHKLDIEGDIDAENIYWIPDDQSGSAYVRRACFNFGTKRTVRTDAGLTAANMLTASIEADTLSYDSPDYTLSAAKFKLGVGTRNKSYDAKSHEIIPIGGRLTLKSMEMNSWLDSMIVKARDVSGAVTLRSLASNKSLPEFIFKLTAGRLSSGDPSMRMRISNSEIEFNAHKLPLTKHEKAIKHLADSLHRKYPALDRDSVYNLAMAKYRNQSGINRHKSERTDSIDTEIIDLSTSPILQRILREWEFDGCINAKHASMFTTYFPVKTRIRNFDIDFNNDSIKLNKFTIKAGRSDLEFDGCISNVRKALTSRRNRANLKVECCVESDTIDVNELADIIFKGAAFSDTESGKLSALDSSASEDSDDVFDKQVQQIINETTDSVGPVLIPTNIEAELNVKAKNILYSDLLMHDFSGQALLYGGALNLRRLNASSDAGSINLYALYSAPSVNDMKFGFGMLVKDFNIERVLKLVPALDSIMPMMNGLSGIIDADIAATSDIDRHMDFVLPSLSAAIKLEGDSLKLIDEETYKLMAKWLLFKDKTHNMIDHMSVELIVDDNMMQVYPFIFDIDRYKLGIQGYNSLAMDFNYHVAVLKSPIPFKFGINVKGNPDKYKIRLGRAKFNEKTAVERVPIVDTTRVNLISQIENVFRRGVKNSRFASLNVSNRPTSLNDDILSDTISHADSLLLIQEGLIEAPQLPTTDSATTSKKSKKNSKSNGKTASTTQSAATLTDDKKATTKSK